MKGKIKRVWKRVGYTSFVLFSLYQIYLSVRIYWFTFCVIPTYSMSPTLLGGDYILASLQIPGRRIIEEDESRDERKLVHRLEGIRQVRKNDVAVFNYPYSEDKEKMILSAKLFFCKRCVALPGDTYQWFARESLEKVYLPKVGDILPIDSCNYNHYRHCIEYETGQSLKLEMGLVYLADTLLTEYHFKHDYYFMLGDNVNYSYDSRNWGLLPDDFILGVGQFIWFSKVLETGQIRWNRIFKKL